LWNKIKSNRKQKIQLKIETFDFKFMKLLRGSVRWVLSKLLKHELPIVVWFCRHQEDCCELTEDRRVRGKLVNCVGWCFDYCLIRFRVYQLGSQAQLGNLGLQLQRVESNLHCYHARFARPILPAFYGNHLRFHYLTFGSCKI